MIVRYKEPVNDIEVFFGEGIFKSIEHHALRFVPNEFGGILSGFALGKSIFIMDTKIPDKFKSTKSTFSREPEILNQYLKKLCDVTDGWLDYVGEWHSHPIGETDFSGHDHQTMREISNTLSVKMKKPLLLIVSFKKREMTSRLYINIGNDLLPLHLVETI